MISFSPVGGESGFSGAGPRSSSSNGSGRGHQPATSVSSSMNSVDLDDNEPPPPRPAPAAPGPPALPSRKSTASSTSSLPPPLPARKPTLPAPPPEAPPRRQPPFPPKRLDSTPSFSSPSKPRPANPSVSRPPAPSEAATARYSALFTQLLALRRVAKIKLIMAGKAAGWASTDEREGWLQGVVVRDVWERSRLPSDVLRGIWCVLSSPSTLRRLARPTVPDLAPLRPPPRTRQEHGRPGRVGLARPAEL